jgi:hypothetical protein
MLFAKYLPGMYQGADHTGRRVFNFGGGGGGGQTQALLPSLIFLSGCALRLRLFLVLQLKSILRRHPEN